MVATIMMRMMMVMMIDNDVVDDDGHDDNDDDAGAPRLGRPGELQHPGGEDHQAQRAIGGNGKMTLLIN